MHQMVAKRKRRKQAPCLSNQPLVRQLHDRMLDLDVPATAIAATMGVGSSTIGAWYKRTANPSLFHFICAVQALGGKLEITWEDADVDA